MMHTLLIGSTSVERNDDLLFINLDGGQTNGGTTIALSAVHAGLLAKNIASALANPHPCAHPMRDQSEQGCCGDCAMPTGPNQVGEQCSVCKVGTIRMVSDKEGVCSNQEAHGQLQALPKGLFSVAQAFRAIVDAFIAGQRFEARPMRNTFAWVARHDGFESLIVECPSQGDGAAQYTLATKFTANGEPVAYRVGHLGLSGDGFDH